MAMWGILLRVALFDCSARNGFDVVQEPCEHGTKMQLYSEAVVDLSGEAVHYQYDPERWELLSCPTVSTLSINAVISSQHPQFIGYSFTLRNNHFMASSSFFSLAKTTPYLEDFELMIETACWQLTDTPANPEIQCGYHSHLLEQ